MVPREPLRGAFPFVFDCPDFLSHEELKLPQIRPVQLCAFAQQCVLFTNELDFTTHAKNRRITLSSDAFIALGLADESGGPLAEPLASAMLVGRVVEAALLRNRFSKQQFWWLKLANRAGELDLVAAPELLPRPPKPGNILQSSVWLYGKVLSAES